MAHNNKPARSLLLFSTHSGGTRLVQNVCFCLFSIFLVAVVCCTCWNRELTSPTHHRHTAQPHQLFMWHILQKINPLKNNIDCKTDKIVYTNKFGIAMQQNENIIFEFRLSILIFMGQRTRDRRCGIFKMPLLWLWRAGVSCVCPCMSDRPIIVRVTCALHCIGDGFVIAVCIDRVSRWGVCTTHKPWESKEEISHEFK